MKLASYLIAYAKVYSTWVKGLNLGVKTVKLLEEAQENLNEFESGDGSKAHATKEKIDKLDFITI